MSIRTELKCFIKSFKYAGSGIMCAVKTQRNMRFHMGAVIPVGVLESVCRVSRSESLALLLTVGGVIALECLNTAVENAVDLASGGKLSDHAKRAKDCAAGAVLIFCVAALIEALMIFGTRYREIIRNFSETPWLTAAAVIYTVLWFIWIFVCFTHKQDKNNDKQ